MRWNSMDIGPVGPERLSFLSPPKVWLMKAAGHRMCWEMQMGIWVSAAKAAVWCALLGHANFRRTPSNLQQFFSPHADGSIFFGLIYFLCFTLQYFMLAPGNVARTKKNRLVLRPVHKFSPGRLFSSRGSLGHKSLGNKALHRLKCI